MRVIGHIVDKYDKSSLIVLVLVVALMASVVLVIVEGGLQIAQNLRIGNSAAFAFNPLCTQVRCRVRCMVLCMLTTSVRRIVGVVIALLACRVQGIF
jgi:hypothetical protein